MQLIGLKGAASVAPGANESPGIFVAEAEVSAISFGVDFMRRMRRGNGGCGCGFYAEP